MKSIFLINQEFSRFVFLKNLFFLEKRCIKIELALINQTYFYKITTSLCSKYADLIKNKL